MNEYQIRFKATSLRHHVMVRADSPLEAAEIYAKANHDNGHPVVIQSVYKTGFMSGKPTECLLSGGNLASVNNRYSRTV